ncbi:hypothetical protein IAU60_003188 [Kwoniella sp. DSM 27419]
MPPVRDSGHTPFGTHPEPWPYFQPYPQAMDPSLMTHRAHVTPEGGRPCRARKTPAPFDEAHPRPAKPRKKTSRSRSTSTAREKTHPPDTAIFLPDPKQPPVQLKGVAKNGLLPAPPGAILDVNDLLILHPPSDAQTINHTSQFEMYTCRVCSKTYDGKNARSVARRHLQDKHGVPLAVQKRRSRWDLEPGRPKSKQETRARELKAKRNWATKNRHIQRLEKAHAPFLERFGPEGVVTSGGTRLVAPKFRTSVAKKTQTQYLDGTQGNVILPEALLQALQELKGDKPDEAVDREPEPSAPVAPPAPPLAPSFPPYGLQYAPYYTHTYPWPGYGLPFVPFPRPSNPLQAFEDDDESCESEQQSGAGYFMPSQVDVNPAILDAGLPQEMEVDSTPSSPESITLPEQKWVPTDWSSHELPPKLGPPIQIPVQGKGQDQWRVPAEGPGPEQDADAHSEAEQGEAVAAESLLNLHSTPMKGPEENGRNDIQLAMAQDAQARAQVQNQAGAPSPGWTSRARPLHARTKSSIRPFRDPRPEVTRSLSFDQRALDDPFAFAEIDFGETPHALPPASSPPKAKKRHTISLPSPSSGRKQRASPLVKPPLQPLSTNVAFLTPLRPSTASVPQSLTREYLQFPSSPCDAAALGLVPTHLAPATPGLRGAIGADTPEAIEARRREAPRVVGSKAENVDGFMDNSIHRIYA